MTSTATRVLTCAIGRLRGQRGIATGRIHTMFKQLVLSAALLATPLALPAQTPAAQPAKAQAAPSLTPQQQAQLKKQNAQMAQAALQVAQLVDQGKAGEVWDGASAVAKQIVKRDAFIQQTASSRQQAGKLQGRQLAAITRTASSGGKTPAGDYINVNFATRFANAKQPVRELVSFHRDSDKVWRVSGYTLR